MYSNGKIPTLQIDREITSDITQVQHGVPLGLVLGPTLFSIYMLPLRQTSLRLPLYADNTQIYNQYLQYKIIIIIFISTKSNSVVTSTVLTDCLQEIKLVLTYKVAQGLAPSYISDLISITTSRSLRSANSLLYQPPCRLKTMGQRAF